MKIPNEDFVTNSTTIVLEVNLEVDTNKTNGNQRKITPYLHPNLKIKHLKKSKNLYESHQIQGTYVPKKVDVFTIKIFSLQGCI